MGALVVVAIAAVSYLVASRERLMRWPFALPLAVAVAAGSAVVLTSGQPTGWPPADWLLRGAVVVLSAAAASRTPAFVTLLAGFALAAVLLAVESGMGALVAVAIGAGAARFVGSPRGRASETAGALAGAALALVVLDLRTTAFAGSSSAIAAAFVVPIVVTGLTASPARVRRRAGWIGAALLGAALAATAASMIAVWQARTALGDAVTDARAGLDAARDAHSRDAAREHLESARANFDRSERHLTAFWAQGGRAVPIVGNHLKAIRELTSTGRSLSSTALDALDAVSADRLRPVGGRIDLTALTETTQVLNRARFAVDRATDVVDEIDSPWLVAPLERRRAELAADLADARQPVRDAADGATVALRLLGSEQPQRFAVLMMSNSESRSAGGFPGSYAIISLQQGVISLDRVGRAAEDFNPSSDLVLHPPADFEERYAFNGYRTVGTLVLTPDFPTAARLFVEAFPQLIGEQVDGVIGIDPFVLGALLQLTGPIEVASWPDSIDESNVEKVLLYDQYARLGGARGEFQGDVVREVYEKLVSGAVPSPDSLIDALGPVIRGRHLQFFSNDPFSQDFFVRTRSAGAVTTPVGDSFGVFTQNLVGNKIDWFLTRALDLDVTYDPGAGAVATRARVTLTNAAPSTGLPAAIIGNDNEAQRTLPGLNRTWVNVYSTARLTGATLGGAPLRMVEQFELGRRVYWAEVLVPAGQAVTLELQFTSAVAPGAAYPLELLRQAVVRPDQVTLAVHAPPGWQLTVDAPAAFEQNEPKQIEIVPERR